VAVRTIFGYQAYTFLLDTGADFTMLPRYMADDLGISLSQCRQIPSFGIEGSALTTYVSTIHVKLAAWDFDLTCLISAKDVTPFILGRMGLFDRFSVTFDNRRKQIVLIRL